MTGMRLVNEVPARIKKQIALWTLQRRARTAGFRPDSFRRIEDYLDVSLRLQAPRFVHPLQRPRMYFPELPTRSWHDPSHFAWITELERASAVIKKELLNLLIPGSLQHHHQGLTDAGQWNVYYLYQLGRKVEEHCRRCPQTTQILDSITGLASTGLVYFSVLTEGTHITPHCGPTNTRLRCHLGLIVPQGCRMRVGEETRSWEEGKCLIFDDSFEHEVWNSAQQARVVLVLDVWHPQLTTAERWALSQIMRMSSGARRFFKAVRKQRNTPTNNDTLPLL